MGYKMKAKFDSTCKECGKSTKEGEEIYYDRDSKAACNDLDCYKKQGGSAIEFPKSGGGGYKPAPLRPIADRIIDTNEALKNAVEQYKGLAKIIPIPEKDVATFLESLTKTAVGAR
jgi:hypothetical protein